MVHDDHSKCVSFSWCHFRKGTEKFSFTVFPSEINSSFSILDMIKKLAPFASSQGNESLNSLVPSKCPKLKALQWEWKSWF